MKVLQNGRTVTFSKRTDCYLAAASVNKMATLLGVSRTAVYKVIMAYTNHRKKSSDERNSS